MTSRPLRTAFSPMFRYLQILTVTRLPSCVPLESSFNINVILTVKIPFIKIIRSHSCLVFIMGIRTHRKRKSLDWNGPMLIVCLPSRISMAITSFLFTIDALYLQQKCQLDQIFLTGVVKTTKWNDTFRPGVCWASIWCNEPELQK